MGKTAAKIYLIFCFVKTKLNALDHSAPAAIVAMAPRSPRSPRAGARVNQANRAALAGVTGAAEVIHGHARLWPTLVAQVETQMRAQQARRKQLIVALCQAVAHSREGQEVRRVQSAESPR